MVNSDSSRKKSESSAPLFHAVQVLKMWYVGGSRPLSSWGKFYSKDILPNVSTIRRVLFTQS